MEITTEKQESFLPNKQDANAGIILRSDQIQIFSETVKFAVDKGIAIKEVEKIHRPNRWLKPVSRP